MDKRKEQELRMKTIVYDMENGNKNCADCNKESMDYASINNGTIICEECAEKHKKLGHGISYLRAFNERWDDYLLNYIRTGGNSRFIHFAKAYHISGMDVELKYKTKASEYYREILRSEVMGYDPPDNINLNTANEVLDVIENNYPEFENYTFVKHVDLDALEKNIKKNEESKGFFSSVTGFFGSVTKQLDQAAEKLADLSVSEKVFEHGSKMFDGLKNITESATKNIKGAIDGIVGDDEKEKEEGEKVEVDVNEEEPKQDNNINVNVEEKKEEVSTNEEKPVEEIKEENKETPLEENKTTPVEEKPSTTEEPAKVENVEPPKEEEVKTEEPVKEEAKEESKLDTNEDDITKKIEQIEKQNE